MIGRGLTIGVLLSLAVFATAHGQEDVILPDLEPKEERPEQAGQTPLPAAPTPLEDVVVLAARRPQPLRAAAASTSVITAADLDAYGWRDFLDAINSLAGFYTTDPRDLTYLGVRGVSIRGDANGRVLILVDGHQQQELWSHSAYPEQLGLDASLIDHIEVLRGPASALYGSLGFLAIINVVTRRGAPDGWARATYEMRDLTLFRAAATVGHRHANGLEWGVAAQAHLSRGDGFTYPDLIPPAGVDPCDVRYPYTCNTGGRSDRERDASRGLSVYGHLAFRGLSVEASYQFYDKQLPFAPYATLFNDPANHYLVTRGYLDGRWQAGRPETLEVSARGYADLATYVDDLAYPADDRHPGRTLFHDEAHPYWAGGEVKLLAERLWWDRLRAALTVGGEVTYLYGDDTSGVVGAPSPVHVARGLLLGSVYGQGELAYRRALALTVGVRGDFSDTFASELSPRAGLVWFPYESGTLKLLYAHGFIHPSWYQAFFRDDVSIQDNPRLGPERADNYEVIFQQQLGRPLVVTASGFYIQGDHLIEQVEVCVPSPGAPPAMGCAMGTAARLQSQNSRSFRSLGGELGVVGRFASGARLYASYSYAHATDSSDPKDTRAVNSPEHVAKAGVSWPLWRDHLVGGVEAHFWSSRRLPYAMPSVETDPFLLLSAHLTWKDLPKGLAATLTVSDLTGQTWYEPSVAEDSRPVRRIPHGGPTATLRLSYAY